VTGKEAIEAGVRIEGEHTLKEVLHGEGSRNSERSQILNERGFSV